MNIIQHKQLTIECPDCGTIFTITPHDRTTFGNVDCPSCGRYIIKPEKYKVIMDNENIVLIKEKSFWSRLFGKNYE